MNRRLGIVVLFAVLVSGCDALQHQALKTYMAVEKGLDTDEGTEVVESDSQPFNITALTDELEFPWGFDFLPDGRIIVTERPGNLLLLDPTSGKLESIVGVPAVYYKGQGGLLDVVLHPQFTTNQWIYLSAAVSVQGDLQTTRVTRFRLNEGELTDPKTIFEAIPAVNSNTHFGSAMVFDNAGHLFITMGDRRQRYLAQDLGTSLGKVYRLNDDGGIPADNPFVDTEGALPGIYSFGHRNPQGITIDRKTGRIWTLEHGPQGGDEINLIRAGANYGWPVITYGEEYGGGKIGEGTEKAGMEQPVQYYVPSMGTAGLAYYDADNLPAWRNSLFAAGLRSFSISRVPLDGDRATGDERLLESYRFRARNLQQGPDGNL